MPSAPRPPAGPGSGLRFPALVWALLHAPVFLWLYGGSLLPALQAVPPLYRQALWPALLVEALVLALVAFVVPLPLSPWARVYRVAAPLCTGLATVLLALDARLYATVGFHVNGFFFRVLGQPAALRETGVASADVALAVAQGLGWVAVEVAAGRWFLGRFPSRRPVWRLAVALLLLGAVERTFVGSLTFFGGQAVFAAGQVLPLQVPVRLNAFWSRATGRPTLGNPLRAASESSAVKLPPGLDPAAVHFERKPDILLVLLESLREDYLRPEVMPRLLARAGRQGMVFDHHHTSCPSTFFAVYSLLFGLDAHTLDAVVGTGRKPVLFGALSLQGYSSRILAASSVDWMGLRETVFGDVQGELETDWPKEMSGDQRDATIIAHAKDHVQATPPGRPVFLFLFFFGTHFNYFYPERSARFTPAWNGADALKATSTPPAQILNRGRNAAYELDWKLDEFLDWYERARGQRPLVIVTGDHGEEMREKGHIGHGSALTQEQIQVPMVVLGHGVPLGHHRGATTHADVVPTLFHLLGDQNPPALYSSGLPMFEARDDRFVLAYLGWEPRYAAVSRDLKVAFHGMDAGLGGVTVTDAFDRPLPDGSTRFAAAVPRILQLFQHPAPPAAAAR